MVVENIKNIMGEEFTYIFIANDYGAGVHLFEISKLVNSNKYFVFLGPSTSLLSDRALNYEDLGILDNLPNNLEKLISIGIKNINNTPTTLKYYINNSIPICMNNDVNSVSMLDINIY